MEFYIFLMLEKHLDEMSSVAGFYVKIEILLILSASLFTRPYAVWSFLLIDLAELWIHALQPLHA